MDEIDRQTDTETYIEERERQTESQRQRLSDRNRY